jgi:hypothetical protein
VAVAFSGYAHCPRCGNFDLDRVSSDRVPLNILKFVQRSFGFPGYRCERCRLKFFTARPHRRILPSMASMPEQNSVES